MSTIAIYNSRKRHDLVTWLVYKTGREHFELEYEISTTFHIPMFSLYMTPVIYLWHLLLTLEGKENEFPYIFFIITNSNKRHEIYQVRR